jgi:IS30 family transposase
VEVKKLGRIQPGGGHRVYGRGTVPHATGQGHDYLHCVVEDHSRLAYVEAQRDEKATTCADFLRRAQEFYPRHGISLKAVARHKEIKAATGVQVYFCDPHAPWQRGSNENTNRPLRQFQPRGTDLTRHSRADLSHIAQLLNDRPRKTLGFMKPSERLAPLVAVTP